MVYAGQRGRKRKKRRARIPWLTVCAWTLLAVVGLCLVFPKTAKSIRQKASDALGLDIGGAVSVFGESLKSGENVFKAAKGAFVYAFHADDGEDMPVSASGKTQEPAQNPGDAPAAPAGDAGDSGGATPSDPVEAFRESQESFGGLELPGNVTYEKPEVGKLVTPVEGTVTSGFGYREHPSDGKVRFHYGLDIAAEAGTQALCVADGTVAAVGDSTSYGLYVIVRHQGGVESLYAHLSEVSVKNGDEVKAGDKIGTVGETGNATAPCLHLELLVNGDYVNPGYYLYT